MKNSEKVATVAGVGLFVLAALFSISLLIILFDFGGANPASQTILYRTGKMLIGVYGLCSWLIPLFLIVAAFQCFSSERSIKRAILLLGSIFPFFTLDALEHICRMIASTNTGSVLGIKLTTALLIGLVIVAVEYALIAMLGDILQNIVAPRSDDDEDDENDNFDEDMRFSVTAPQKQEEDDEPKAEESSDESTDEAVEESTEELDETELLAEDDQNPPERTAPETLDNGEYNPFAHVFENISSSNEVAESAESHEKAQEAESSEFEPEVVADEEPEDIKEPETIEESEDNFIPPFPREAPHYNENAFFPEPEEPTEVLELDTFNPEHDSYVGMEEPKEEIPEDVEPIEDEIDEDFMADEDDGAEEIDSEDDTLAEEDFFEEDDVQNQMLVTEPVEPDDDFNDDSLDDSDFLEDYTDESDVDTSFDTDIFDSEDAENAEESADEDTADEAETVTVVQPTVPQRSGLDAIFAEMDDDAASDPVFDEEEEISVPVPQDSAPAESEAEPVDPLAPPVVDSDGIPYGTAEPIDFEEIDLSEMDDKEEEVSVIQKNDFDEDDEGVVRLEKPAPLVEELKPEPKKLRGPYKVPTEGILDTYSNGEYWLIDEETKKAASDLKETLSEFKIEAEVTGIRKGPVVTMFEILPAPGVKLSKIVALQDNIALRLAASSVRIVAPIPGKHAVGIEVPNKERAVVSFKEIVDLDLPQFNKMAIPVILGKDISGEPQVLDLAKTPHLLIAGSTGAGKSVCVNSMILSILYKRSPQQVKLIMIDPKVVELKLYNDIPHLLTPVITESKKAFQSLQYCLCEMERRYACLDGMGVRDITSYNKRIVERNIAAEKLPYIVVIIDEFADLMATTGKELESTIARLAAMSRAVGIHLVLATQRPSIDVITGLIKANIPSRIAFMVASKMDSRIIIDQVGAEKLLGKGDMLYASATDPFPVRIQGTLVNDNEVERVVEYVKQYGEPEYIDDEIFVDDDDDGGSGPGLFSDGEDPLYDEALQIVVQAGKASASYIQRRLKIGYNRAARLVEEMEERGIVGPANGSKPREVIHAPN